MSIDPIDAATRSLEVLDGGGGMSPDETADIVRGLLAVTARLTRERDEAYETVDVRIAGTSRGFLASVAVSMGLETHGEAPELHARILAEHARLTSERDVATEHSIGVCGAVENVRVMLAGTLDALDAVRARLGTVEGGVWPTT